MVPYDTNSKRREVGRVAFWATLCKTVRLRYRTVVLSVLSVCLSVTLVYCGQTVGWIKMKPGRKVGLGHIVLDGDLTSPQKKNKGGRGHISPHFSAHLL